MVDRTVYAKEVAIPKLNLRQTFGRQGLRPDVCLPFSRPGPAYRRDVRKWARPIVCQGDPEATAQG